MCVFVLMWFSYSNYFYISFSLAITGLQGKIDHFLRSVMLTIICDCISKISCGLIFLNNLDKTANYFALLSPQEKEGMISRFSGDVKIQAPPFSLAEAFIQNAKNNPDQPAVFL